MRKEMDKAGVKDPQVLDKSYWIQRVGEVRACLVNSSCLDFVSALFCSTLFFSAALPSPALLCPAPPRPMYRSCYTFSVDSPSPETCKNCPFNFNSKLIDGFYQELT